jgi:hypothetical protein
MQLRKSIFLLSLIGCLFLCSSAFARVLYVDAEKKSGDGSSWIQAQQTIQEAVDLAQESDQIWVKAGMYYLTSTITITKRVAIYGGFAGTETQLNQRPAIDWVSCKTEINGQSTVRCLTTTADTNLDRLYITHGYFNGSGGGINANNVQLTITDSQIYQNRADIFGAGIYITGGTLTILRSIISGNRAFIGYAGGIRASGCAVNITDSTISGNSAYFDGGGLLASNCSEVNLTGTTFSGNVAEESRGGGAYIQNGPAVIDRCIFIGNGAGTCGAGGGIAIGNGTTLIKSSVFVRNRIAGSDIYGKDPSYGGGAIWGSATISNCTIAYNSSNYYSCMTSEGPKGGEGGGIKGGGTVINSFLWGNTAISSGPQIYGSATVSYSNIDQDGFAGTNGNIRIEPGFVDVAANDFHLLPTSLCIDAGNNSVANLPSFDFEGNPRIIDGNGDGNAIVDMGAYEFLNIDTDYDGILDYVDNCPNIPNPQQLDANGNGIGDCCDPTPGCGGCGQVACDQSCGLDSDGDGIYDVFDNCPNVANPLQLDADGDRIGDMCDPTPGCGNGCGQSTCEGQTDADYDSHDTAHDNCPTICNYYQLDADHDGIGDVCDPDPGCGGAGQPVCEVACTPL